MAPESNSMTTRSRATRVAGTFINQFLSIAGLVGLVVWITTVDWMWKSMMEKAESEHTTKIYCLPDSSIPRYFILLL